MEFQEFTLIPAPFGRPIATPAIKGITAAGAKFYNDQGERFLEKYAPELMELSVRSRLTISVAREYQAGRQALLDATFLERPISHLPRVERAGFNWRRDRIPYVLAVHDSLGGIVTDADGWTSIPGLLAVGEAAGFQTAFGADRAGGAILACLVFAHRAGAVSGRELIGKTGPAMPLSELNRRAETFFKNLKSQFSNGFEKPQKLRDEVRRLADRDLNPIRDADGLQNFLRQAPILFERTDQLKASNPHETIQAFEAVNLILTGSAVAACALERKESRGHHYRQDFPRKENTRELRWIEVSGGHPSEMTVFSRPVPFERFPIKPPFRNRVEP
jgi:succinate dehydrogenase/fumarate reductase flavoprotein subunit